MATSSSGFLFAASTLAAAAVPAAAQWTVTSLHPAAAGQRHSVVEDVGGAGQVGWAQISGTTHAGMWNGSADSWVDLHPDGSGFSHVFETAGNQQVGEATFPVVGGKLHAGLWTGTAASWVSLHPAGFNSSAALTTDGTRQGGLAFIDQESHAGMWSGTAASWVDLHPDGVDGFDFIGSEVRGLRGDQQAGMVYLPDETSRASLWNGTAESWIDLNPAGAHRSEVYAFSGARQAGSASIAGHSHAGLWEGTPESFLDLNPEGYSGSRIYDADDTYQVGLAAQGTARAGIWSGTAGSFEDLHAFLPPGFGESYANGVWSDGTTIYVVGTAFEPETQHYRAILWTKTVPAPGTLILLAAGAVFTRRTR